MNDHRKIPVPPRPNQDGKAGTLFERAASSFDLNKFIPPPVPQEVLDQISPRPAVKRTAAAAVEPVAPAPAPAAVKVAEPAPVKAPQPTAPIAAPAAVQPAAEPEAAPVMFPPREQRSRTVSFKPNRHPVDRQHLRDQGFIVPEGGVTQLLEEFRIIKRHLLLQSAELQRGGSGAAAQRVLICSPHPGEGKTYCAVNLALSIAAEKESEVILVDADFAKPSILSALDLPGGPGLMDALRDPKADVADFVLGTDVPGLWVLPAGEATNSDSEYLSTSRTAAVLDRLTEGAPHRILIFDSPPALAASPAAELAKHVGQALLIVRADKTGQGALEDAISLLSGCPNVELLLNATNFSPSGRRFGSYYGYGG